MKYLLIALIVLSSCNHEETMADRINRGLCKYYDTINDGKGPKCKKPTKTTK